MKSAQPEASSDLERGRALSRALSASEPRASEKKAAPVPSYARLASPRSEKRAPLAPLAGGARWPAIVAWAASTEGATAALAIDRKGLLVAVSGLDDDEATRIGGRLALAFDHVSEIERIESFAIHSPQRAIHVASFGVGDEAVLLAVIGATAPGDPFRRAVQACLGE